MGIFAEEIVTTDSLGRRAAPRMRHTIEEKLIIVAGDSCEGVPSVAAVSRSTSVA